MVKLAALQLEIKLEEGAYLKIDLEKHNIRTCNELQYYVDSVFGHKLRNLRGHPLKAGNDCVEYSACPMYVRMVRESSKTCALCSFGNLSVTCEALCPMEKPGLKIKVWRKAGM